MEFPEEVIYTEEELKERLKYWKKKLRLQDWMIWIELAKSQDMMNPNCEAQINHLQQNKQAKILIVHPDHRPHESWYPQDMEWSLVHELLHLHLNPIENENNPNNYDFVEQAIESITHGLIALERK